METGVQDECDTSMFVDLSQYTSVRGSKTENNPPSVDVVRRSTTQDRELETSSTTQSSIRSHFSDAVLSMKDSRETVSPKTSTDQEDRLVVASGNPRDATSAERPEPETGNERKQAQHDEGQTEATPSTLGDDTRAKTGTKDILRQVSGFEEVFELCDDSSRDSFGDDSDDNMHVK